MQPDRSEARTPQAALAHSRYVVIGFCTVAPLWVTWPVFGFVLGIVANAGRPLGLICLPSAERKAVGFISKVLRDAASGRALAAVYVPASGSIEIVPLCEVVQTDWTREEAMAFVVTGGTNAPDSVRLAKPAPPAPGAK